MVVVVRRRREKTRRRRGAAEDVEAMFQNQTQGIDFQIDSDIPVNVSGEDVPDFRRVSLFSELALHKKIMSAENM